MLDCKSSGMEEKGFLAFVKKKDIEDDDEHNTYKISILFPNYLTIWIFVSIHFIIYI